MIPTFGGSPFQNILTLLKNPYYFVSIFMSSFRYEFTCPFLCMFTLQHYLSQWCIFSVHYFPPF